MSRSRLVFETHERNLGRSLQHFEVNLEKIKAALSETKNALEFNYNALVVLLGV